ncbi:MAG: hypothetical protein H7A19_10445 [Rhodanobacteraceae bacterium]|nr:hypothetical protein [Rhodanobacteraceae bacterium]
MFFEMGPREIPPAVAGIAVLRMFTKPLEKRGLESLSLALQGVLLELKPTLPSGYEMDSDGLEQRPNGYDARSHCEQAERLLSALLGPLDAKWNAAWEAHGGEKDWSSGEPIVSAMFRRSLGSVIKAARAEVQGDLQRAWRCIASASMCAGIALGGGFAPDVHAEIKAAFAETGRKGGIAKHAKSKKEEAKALWVAMRNKEPKPNNHLVALAIEEAKHAAYSTALKWITEWRKAKPSALT